MLWKSTFGDMDFSETIWRHNPVLKLDLQHWPGRSISHLMA